MLQVGKLPDYIGVSAFGIKMGVVVPGSDLLGMLYTSLEKCNQDGFLDDGDTICVTESILARSQNNFVNILDVVKDLSAKLNLKSNSRLGVVFPILSRNRFSLIMKALAAAVPKGEVVVQLSFPDDEVGNQLISEKYLDELGKTNTDFITREELIKTNCKHPITQVDYLRLYEELIIEQGAKAKIFLSNDPLKISEFKVDGVVVASVHTRNKILKKLKGAGVNAITLQDICNDEASSWSEWGLLGSNLSSNDKLKLAPREADQFASELQKMVFEKLNKKIEIIIYGDGAYCDPSTGIYELADPQPAFGLTEGLKGKYREGLKYKYLVDKMWDEGKDLENIQLSLDSKKKEHFQKDSIEAEGTTPRKTEDLIASLADLISGSADAGTPLIIVKGFLK